VDSMPIPISSRLHQDADRLWEVSPPAEAALRRLLESPGAELRIGWRVSRTAPPPSPHGGPVCDGSVAVPLAGLSRAHLLQVLDVRAPAPLLLDADESGCQQTRRKVTE